MSVLIVCGFRWEAGFLRHCNTILAGEFNQAAELSLVYVKFSHKLDQSDALNDLGKLKLLVKLGLQLVVDSDLWICRAPAATEVPFIEAEV